jgi:putative Holliday junction resolvase
VGVAVGDAALGMAHPLTTIHAEDSATRFSEIGALVQEWRPVRFIVGLPKHADGTEHEVSRLARRFAQRLEGRYGIEVTLVDERFTSRAAESRLRESGMRSRDIAAALDAASAQEILQAYFDGRVDPPL